LFFYRTTLMRLSSDISAVITGGASGLGAATARRLAAHGVKVALFDLNEAAGAALARELGGVFCSVDVTSEDQVDAGFAKARAARSSTRRRWRRRTGRSVRRRTPRRKPASSV